VYEEKQHIVSLFEDGNVFLSEGNYNLAVNAFTSALALDPGNTEIQEKLNYATIEGSRHSFKMAHEALANEDYLAARMYFLNVSSADTENYNNAQNNLDNLKLIIAEMHLKLAKENYSNKNYVVAYRELTKALESNPSLEQATQLLPKYKKKYVEQLERERKERELQLEKERKEREAKAEEARKLAIQEQRQRDIERMNMYESESGSVKVAVNVDVKTSNTISIYSAGKNHWFVQIWVSTKNYGSTPEMVSGKDFSLATPDGYIVTPHKATNFSTFRSFQDIKLQPGTHTSGGLVFYLPKAEQYTLYFDNQVSRARKIIIIN
jgi:tetratricopeptide (TPR) repeat protein